MSGQNPVSLQRDYELLNRIIIERKQKPVLTKWMKTDDYDDHLKPDLLPLERIFAKLHTMVTTAENTQDHLLFQEQKLKQDCDRLQEQLQAHITECNDMLTKKEETIRNHELRLRKTKAKLSLYELATGIKITINENSTTAFIYNPNEVLLHEIPNVPDSEPVRIESNFRSQSATNVESADKTVSFNPKQIDDMNQIWARLKLPENWQHLVEPDLTYQPIHRKSEHRPALTVLDNMNNNANSSNNNNNNNQND